VADHPEWPPYTNVIAELGPEGISSDETDEDASTDSLKIFRRIDKPWRAQYFSNLFEELDAKRSRLTAMGQPIIGNRPRLRGVGSNKRNQIAKDSLPMNFYSAEWLNLQHDWCRKSLIERAKPDYELPDYLSRVAPHVTGS
jgi:hypothetical protein